MRDTATIAIELRHLRYFLAVVDELHFSRAAERLRMAQPPLSRAIRKLESELGVQLLRRTSRAVVPTEAGLVFAERARETLTTFEAAVSATRQTAGTATTVRVGCSPTQPMDELGHFVEAFRKRFPDLEPQVRDFLIADQLRLLRLGELELGLFADVGELPGIETEPVFAGEQMAAFLSADHPLAARDVLCPADVRNETLLVISESVLTREFRDRYLHLIERGGYHFGRTRDAGGASPRELMLPVAANLGIAVHRASLGDTSGAHGVVVRRPLYPPLRLPDTVLAWSTDAPEELSCIIAAARDAARDMRRQDPTATDLDGRHLVRLVESA